MKIRFSLLFFAPLMAFAATDAGLHLTINGVHSNKGHVLISVFDSANGFPNKPTKAVRVARLKADTKPLTTGFSGLKPGEYAVAFIHAENDNHKLDAGDDGAPTEGFGFSNDPQLNNGAATYDQAKFNLVKRGQEIVIKTVYLDESARK
jgi:uncharacterized protein (DUF2141 family)